MALIEKMKDTLNSKTGILGIAALVVACSGMTAWDVLASADTTDSTDNTTTEISLGDLNGDSEVNASDAAMVLVAAASVGAGDTSGLTEEQEIAADLNSDGSFDAVDAAQILTYAAYVGSGGTATLNAFLNGEYEDVESTTKPTETSTSATETTTTQPPVQTTAKPVQTTVATTKAPAQTTTVATQPPVDESNSITRNGYYGKAWDFWNGGGYLAYCWTSSTHIVAYDFSQNKVVIDYELSGQEYTDFMYVYNNEIACGSYPASAVSTAFKYINTIKSWGRDRCLYTNDIEDDGVCSSYWAVWATEDGEYWFTV